MKLNKTLALAALVAGSFFTGGLTVQAQDSSTNTPPGDSRPLRPRGPNLEMLSKQLDLTDDQKPKVKAVLDDQMQKMKDLRADSTLSQDDRRAKMKEIRDNTTAQMKGILTPDQFEKYQKLMPGRHRPMPTPPAGGAMTTTNTAATSN